MSSTDARKMSASVGDVVATLPAGLADLSGSVGEKLRKNLPESELVTRIWQRLRGLRDGGGATEEEMGDVGPRGWKDRGFRREDLGASGNSDRDVLAAHDAETINSHKAHKKLGKQVNRVHYDRNVTSLDELPIRARPPEEVGPFWKIETHEYAKARQLGRSGLGAAARGRWMLHALYQSRSSCT